MANFKCPDCGATLTDDSKFCKYCGAKIDDGVKRVEVNVNKRIEDIAEIKRAEREERESLKKEKKEKAKTIWKWIKIIICVALMIAGYFITTSGSSLYGLFLTLGGFFFLVLSWLTKIL